MEMLLTLVLQVVLAVVVAKLTLAGSRSQKWWERKADLYASFIEKLSYIQRHYSHLFVGTQQNRANLSRERKEELKTKDDLLYKRTEEASEEVEKFRCIGTFLISDAVHRDLHCFSEADRDARKAYGEHQQVIRLLEDLRVAAKKCSDSVKEHSKDDLGVNSRFGRFIHEVRCRFSE